MRFTISCFILCTFNVAKGSYKSCLHFHSNKSQNNKMPYLYHRYSEAELLKKPR